MAVKGGLRVPTVVTVDAKELEKLYGQLDKMKKRAGGVSKVLKGAAVAAGGAALIAIGKKALDEAKQAYEISRLTDIVVKNTGASAWTSSQQVGALANSISNLTGIDDELIQAGSNVLLSFGNIRNAGTGAAAVFDRATQAATDMGKALGKDPAVAAKLLGKALNDPVKGLGSLSKAGIKLTNEQQAQIKAMQARGDLLGAQQTVLAAVEGRFKGAAAAMATPMERLQTTLNNMLETIGVPLMNMLAPVLGSLQPVFDALTPILEELGGVLGEVISQLVTGLKPVLPELMKVIRPLLPVVGLLAQAIGALLPIVVLLAPYWTFLAKVLSVVVASAIKVVTGVIWGLLQAIKYLVLGLSKIPRIGNMFKGAIKPLEDITYQLGEITKASFEMPAVGDNVEASAEASLNAAKKLKDGAKATIDAGKDFAKAAKKSTSRAAVRPKTARVSAAGVSTADQSFTVAGRGGGISLSVTVNGSIMQERDVARTIRDELLQFARRQGVNLSLGV